MRTFIPLFYSSGQLLLPNTHKSLNTPVTAAEFAPFLQGLKQIGAVGFGLCVLIALTALVIAITKLGLSAGNDVQRTRALQDILVPALALSLFGGAAVLIGLFMGIF